MHYWCFDIVCWLRVWRGGSRLRSVTNGIWTFGIYLSIYLFNLLKVVCSSGVVLQIAWPTHSSLVKDGFACSPHVHVLFFSRLFGFLPPISKRTGLNKLVLGVNKCVTVCRVYAGYVPAPPQWPGYTVVTENVYVSVLLFFFLYLFVLSICVWGAIYLQTGWYFYSYLSISYA